MLLAVENGPFHTNPKRKRENHLPFCIRFGLRSISAANSICLANGCSVIFPVTLWSIDDEKSDVCFGDRRGAGLGGTARADVFNMPGGQTSISLVPVGNAGNAPDPATGNLYGSVSYNYSIDAYDVTLAQYTVFLNAVAKTDTYGLYNIYMGGANDYYSTQGIMQSGSPGSYSYSVTGSNPQAANCPAFDVTWFDAARFCNWLQNGQLTGVRGTGTTETGAYTLNGDTTSGTESRNANAKYFIPSENEWYKAAYYNPSSATCICTYRNPEQHRAGELAGSRAQQRQLLQRRLHRPDELPDACGVLLHFAKPLRDI